MKIISPDVDVFYSPEFAVGLARWIGYRDPLIDRLRNLGGPITQPERDYLAEVLADPKHRWPTPGKVNKRREKLKRAAFYLEFLWERGEREKQMAAYDHAAAMCHCSASAVQRDVKWAEKLAGGEWWKMVEHLAKKGPRKSTSLHLTY